MTIETKNAVITNATIGRAVLSVDGVIKQLREQGDLTNVPHGWMLPRASEVRFVRQGRN